MEDVIKIVKSLQESGLLMESVGETIENETTEQKDRFLSLLIRTLGSTLLGNLLSIKGARAAGQGRGVIGAGDGIIRGDLFMLAHSLTNFEYKDMKINPNLMVFI